MLQHYFSEIKKQDIFATLLLVWRKFFIKVENCDEKNDFFLLVKNQSLFVNLNRILCILILIFDCKIVFVLFRLFSKRI